MYAGIGQINGFVYCTAPNLNYFVGSTIMGSWMTVCSLAVVLALDRCLSVTFEKLQIFLFDGWRVNVWIFICVLEGVLFTLFTAPIFYNGHLLTFYIDPFATYGFTDEVEYSSYILNINNIAIGIVLFVIYIIFSSVFAYNYFIRHKKTLTASLRNPVVSLFCTVFVYSSVLTAASLLYMVSQMITASRYFIIFSTIIGISSYGLNGIIYLLLNPSLRRTVFNLRIFNWGGYSVSQYPHS
uniref:7TM_GPCR_Srx domain-containing protein n=1 Tax=Rhabditophanes sp. KR3021 TaxID=114890 RepID=A0AC35TI77_9BILA